MSLTRNETAVHETHGPIAELSCQGAMAQVVGPIDLRLFFSHWHAGFAVTEEVRSGLRSSFQVFDASGASVLKLYAVEGTDRAAWERLRERHLGAEAAPVSFVPPAAPAPGQPDGEIDRAALREGWLALEHTRDFFRVLRRTGAGREQALRLAGEDLARRVEPHPVRALLEGAAAETVPIMCFVVGNPGCIQMFSGPVEHIVPMRPWLNVLDPAFNLHLRADRIASAWVVVKPTRLRGAIPSVELSDAEGMLACQFFGARPPGEGEREAWRGFVARACGGLPAAAQPASG
jgi:putative hemin transport protein